MACAGFVQLIFRPPSYPILLGQFKKKQTISAEIGSGELRSRFWLIFDGLRKLEADSVILGPDGLELVLVGKQDINQRRVEMLASFRLEVSKDGIPRPGFVVNPAIGQGIKNIGHPDDAAMDGDCLASKPVRIPVPIPAFMVEKDDAGRRLNDRAV